MTTSKSNGAYDTLISLRDKLTRLNGVITPEAADKLEDELGGIFTVAKTHHYIQGQKYGHLASAIPESKYRLIIGDATWIHGVPDDPRAHSQDALTVGNAAAQREQFVAEHKILQKSYNDYLGVEEAGKELILYSVGDDALAPLKQLYIGFGDTTVLGMIDHLRLKNGNQDDDSAEARVQDDGIQQPVGSDNEHHSIFHAARLFPGVTGRPRHRNKQGGENDGSGSTDVEQRNVHRRPDGCMGKQNHGPTDVGCTPNVLH